MAQQWYAVGKCGECQKVIWSDTPPTGDGPPTGKTYPSCRCEQIKKDPLNKPLPPPPKDPRVLACEMAGGHIVSPASWPLRVGPDPAKWNVVHEICPCIRCGVNVVLEGGVHKSLNPLTGEVVGKDPRGITVLAPPTEEEAA